MQKEQRLNRIYDVEKTNPPLLFEHLLLKPIQNVYIASTITQQYFPEITKKEENIFPIYNF